MNRRRTQKGQSLAGKQCCNYTIWLQSASFPIGWHSKQVMHFLQRVYACSAPIADCYFCCIATMFYQCQTPFKGYNYWRN